MTAIESVADSTVLALKTATRELRVELPSQAVKEEMMKGLQEVCPNLS